MLKITFREIWDLSQVDFETAMTRLDAVAKVTQNPKVRFSTLGLVLTKESIARWNTMMTLPGEWLYAAMAVSNTMSMLECPTPEKVVVAINGLRRGSLSVEEFDIIAGGAQLSTLRLSPLKIAMTALPSCGVPQELTGKDIGEWLRQQHVETISKLL